MPCHITRREETCLWDGFNKIRCGGSPDLSLNSSLTMKGHVDILTYIDQRGWCSIRYIFVELNSTSRKENISKAGQLQKSLHNVWGIGRNWVKLI